MEEDELGRVHAALARKGALVVHVGCENIASSRLGEKVATRIETELAARGSTSPGLGAEDDADALLSDQLFRARKLGHPLLCLTLGGLSRLALPLGGLEASDARSLAFYSSATRERPVCLLLRESDRALVAFAAPIPLLALLSPSSSEPDAPEPPPQLGDVDDDPVETRETEEQRADPVCCRPEPGFRAWVTALHDARGPQPLATFERLFTQSYLPLANAIACGLADAKAKAAHDEFQRTFARAYTEACPTFVVTGKRPKMVFDAHDIAKKLVRLHDARAAHLVLVDAMRWDVGLLVRDHVRASFGEAAIVADAMALFSAMPTVTSRQLQGLACGVESLRTIHDPEREPDPVRGRTTEVIRRVKVGSRDVFKLDVIEAGLAKAQVHALAVLPELAAHAGDAIVKHAKTLPPRTLLFVFGDHGFLVDGEGAAHQGGASPEEVIVPAFAFVTGEETNRVA